MNKKESSHIDELTGLLNRKSCLEKFSQTMAAAKASPKESPLSLALLDVDIFSKMNEQYGHLTGDNLLVMVAHAIREYSGKEALCGRYGGDEFVLVLQGFDKVMALKKAEEIRARMKQTVYLTKYGHQVNLSASFGIATFPDDAGDVLGLLALADRAMFDVKEKGKDAVKSA